jgi:hypothetical protein
VLRESGITLGRGKRYWGSLRAKRSLGVDAEEETGLGEAVATREFETDTTLEVGEGIGEEAAESVGISSGW